MTADPELILLGDAAYGTTADAVEARPGWSVMTAVKDGAIKPVDDVIITRPGPRLVDGLRALAARDPSDAAIPGAVARPRRGLARRPPPRRRHDRTATDDDDRTARSRPGDSGVAWIGRARRRPIAPRGRRARRPSASRSCSASGSARVAISPGDTLGDPRPSAARHRCRPDVVAGDRDDRLGPAAAAGPDGDGRRASALAVAGATFQGLLRNPLADPYVLGTASGAALGAAIARRHPDPR